jgi:DNA-binding NarL/FixJ family response regulator
MKDVRLWGENGGCGACGEAHSEEDDPCADLDEPRDPAVCAVGALSNRQRQVAELAARGLAQKVIADDLGIAQSTVATHLRKVLRRTGLRRFQLPAAMLGHADRGAGVGPDLAELTTAEREIIAAALDGWSNAQIARRRQRSPRTVANQLAAAYRKLSVASRGELFAAVRLVGGADAAMGEVRKAG